MSTNSAVFIGKIMDEPEFSQTEFGMEICTFNLTTWETYKKETTYQWHHIRCKGSLCDIVAKHVFKGCLACVVGRVEYFNKDGVRIPYIAATTVTAYPDAA